MHTPQTLTDQRRRPTPVLAALTLALSVIAGTAATGAGAEAAPYRDTLTGWADRLDAAATVLETEPERPITRIGSGPLLKRGGSGERVERLTQRLAELGFLDAARRGDLFDEEVDTAVRAFQFSQRMKVDGLVGGGTRVALDRSPQEAAAQMRRSALSMRAFRDTAPDTVILVNLPSQTTTLVRDGEEALTMRSIVGRPSRETPLLQDQITHVIVNPTWTVPPTVLKEDKLPLLRAKGTPGIANAVVYLDGAPVEPAVVDWSNVSPRRVRIVQQPGDHNALGRYRFNMTNPYNIYLHGTNEPRLFDREIRTVSSGCVRLEDARGMAEALLATEHVSTARLDRMLDRQEPQWIKLSQPVPVRFVYWTATVDDRDAVRLHPDIYDLNEDTAPAAAPDPTGPGSATPMPPAQGA
ncbi:putative peptidoglycan binding protein [Azospirillum brasilense]|uniref:Putative peptidoglycan binding protein n=1 Tax=Azospirillum brasilense TaxID=192 RepID=A0A560CPC3_AZOBR|nr:L,D-transpeptidase family protein [Azospirillum brasilense]TWA86695.1 putative peptidoglycan binding protein [Azospirillum brasilense]